MQIDWFPLWLSLRVAALATVGSLAGGLWLAYMLAKRQWRGKQAVETIATLPLALPSTVTGYYLIVVLGQGTALGQLYETVTGHPLMFTWQAAVVASALHAFPLLVKSSRAAFEAVDVCYENAARNVGAGEWRIFLGITLPLAQRAILAATVLAFARALGEFGVTLMIAGSIPGRTQTAAVAIYEAAKSGHGATARALVLGLSLLTAGGVYLANRLERREASLIKVKP